jgi:hypothetical protein
MGYRLTKHRPGRGAVVTGLVASTIALPLMSTAPAAAAVNLCGHPHDAVPPQISSLTFSTETVDTSNGPQRVRLSAAASDTANVGAGSGVKAITAYLTGPHRYLDVNLHLATGSADNGVWTGVVTFSQKNWPGTYTLQDLSAVDTTGNYQDYPNYGSTAVGPDAISLQSGWDSVITVTGPTPTKQQHHYRAAGVLSHLGLSATSVNTTKSSKRVIVTARLTGTQPSRVYAFLGEDRGKTHGYVALRARLTRAGHQWRGHFVVPRWLGDATPQLSVEVDFGRYVRPGYREYDTDKLKLLGFVSSLAITSGVDTVPPQLTHLTVTPGSVDTTTGAQTVTVTAAAHSISGVKTVLIDFSRNSGFQVDFGAGSNAAGVAKAAGPGSLGYFDNGGNVEVRLKQTGSTWTGTGTFRRCVLSGKWRINATVADNAGNGLFAGSGKLAKLGFPSTLQVTAAPEYVFDPVVTSATAAGAYHQITLDFDEGVENLTTSNLTAYAMSPAATRYQVPLPITSIACSNGTSIIDCSGSAGLVTSAVLTIPAVTGGRHYEVWADLDATTSQVTNAGGLPISWQYAIAQVQGD